MQSIHTYLDPYPCHTKDGHNTFIIFESIATCVDNGIFLERRYFPGTGPLRLSVFRGLRWFTSAFFARQSEVGFRVSKGPAPELGPISKMFRENMVPHRLSSWQSDKPQTPGYIAPQYLQPTKIRQDFLKRTTLKSPIRK